MPTVEWELGANLYASVLVDPALPIKMSFFFLPKERVNDATEKGRVGDLNTSNDIVEIPSDPALEQDEDPFLTLIATMVPGRQSQTEYSFDLVFFDEENKDLFLRGTPLEDLEFLSVIPFADTFNKRFIILDERLAIEYFEWI